MVICLKSDPTMTERNVPVLQPVGSLRKLDVSPGKRTTTSQVINCFGIKACLFLFLVSYFGFNRRCFVNLC